MKWYQTSKFKYFSAGFIFGFCFPIIAILIDLFRLDLSWTWDKIALVQSQNPIHYIINTAPLFLGLFALIAGSRQDKIKEINNNLENEIERKIISLKQSTQELEKSLRFKEIFLANMSHEIRTPMNGILGMLSLIQEDDSLSPSQKDYINTIQESSLGLMNILNDVLDLSKLEVGMMELKPSVVNIHEVIQQVGKIFRAIAKQKGIVIHYNINPAIPVWLKVDKNRLSQVISNLIGNAIKFTEEGSITIALEHLGEPEKKEQHLFKISVTDTGIGLSEKDQSLIFREFLQLEYHASKGTGLGLAICEQLVSLMGGKIGVNSKEGEGATFWFTFEAALGTANEREIERPAAKNRPKFNLNILLVEDNKVNQKVANLMLEKMGCRVVIAENGLEALEAYLPDTFDLILMDVQMPKMDGVTATKALKKQHQNLPPIIGLSANAMQGDAQKYIEQGMDDYIAKPILLDNLTALFEKWFG